MQVDLFGGWGTRIERERHTRIKLCVWAYAYEIDTEPIATDAQFDALAMQSNVSIKTGRFDEWWAVSFAPHTGSWIRSHPDLDGVQQLFDKLTQMLRNL